MGNPIVTALTRPRIIICVVAAIALIVAGTVAWTSTRGPVAAALTIWGGGTPAGVQLDDDTQSIELGTAFTPTVDGQATAIRFYKLEGQTGVHTGTIWAPDGSRLATVTFDHESASGWQTARLTSPVGLTAGRQYVVSYRVPARGHYAATFNFSGRSQTSELSVPHRNSGVYGVSGKHPGSSRHSSQYWADLTFVANHGKPAHQDQTSGPTSSAGGSATSTPTPTPTPNPKPKPTPTTKPSPSPTSGASSGAGSQGSAASGQFPTRSSAGLPAGWAPTKKVTGDYHVTKAGTVVNDLQITNGTIYVEAPNVTLNRIKGVGAFVVNTQGSKCFNGLLVENSTFVPNGNTKDVDPPVIRFGGYTVKNIVIDGQPEGLRVGDSDIGCGPVTVQDSFIRVTPPTACTDWHGDGIQGYQGSAVTVRNTTILMVTGGSCGTGTAPFFYPKNQGNTSAVIDGLLLGGNVGYAFRDGMPGTVKNLNVVSGSWEYGPVDVNCSVITAWQAQVVTLNSAGQPVPTGTSIACKGGGG